MYGLLLENLAAFIKIQWGEGKWESVRRHAGVDSPSFSIHHVYAETLIPRLARSAVAVLGVGEREFFEAMGVYFVEFMGQYGYDQVMSVLGRHMRDFLNGLDNLHEYLKFSYPRMRAPSFYCDNETIDGLTLHYRSKRRGYVHYAMGQIKQVGKHFYDTNVEVELLSEEMDGEMMHVQFQLKFDNQAYGQAQSLVKLIREEEQLPVKASMLFELFPFCVVFCHGMIIRHVGHSLLNVFTDLAGQTISDAFDLVRPNIPFAFTNILERRNVVFELVTVAAIQDSEPLYGEVEEDAGVTLKLRGQMLHMEEWKMMIFLATPQMPDLDSLLASGLYINDLSLHDCSRDLVLAGTQQSVELKLALDQEQQKSRKLEDSMKQLDSEMRRTDELLYQMIPKQVADRIRRGENPVDTCEVFDNVSILFSDVVTFTDICSRIKPMQVVTMLNHMYSLFDQLTERNGVYKVETIGDAYMVVSGAPNKDENHAERICDMAMDMVDASKEIKDPSGETDHLQLRVGIHSGDVVAGVVGLKMPRYCLFGDTVNTSSRMESTSAPNKIQISETTKALLPKTYLVEFRGEVAVKGKGQMSTFWLNGRKERIPLSEMQSMSFQWSAPVISSGTGGHPEGVGSISDNFKSATPSLDEMRGKTFSESNQSITGPPLGRFVREPKSTEGSPRPSSRPGLFSQDSLASQKNTADGHYLHHQPSVSSMNIEAARAAIAEVLRGSRKPVENYPGEFAGAPPPFSPGALRSVHSGSISDLRKTGSISDIRKARITSGKKNPDVFPSFSEPPTPVNTTALPDAAIIPAQVVEPEKIMKKMEPGQNLTTIKSEEIVAEAEPSGILKEIENIEFLKEVEPGKVVKIEPEVFVKEIQPVEFVKEVGPIKFNLNPGESSQAEGGTPNSQVDEELVEVNLRSYNPATNSSARSEKRNGVEKEGVGPKAERLVRRLKDNKAALLTSDALNSMGCTGFVNKQKEVMSTACSLL